MKESFSVQKRDPMCSITISKIYQAKNADFNLGLDIFMDSTLPGFLAYLASVTDPLH